MAPDVRCQVDSCVFWLPGKKCGAGRIDVLHQSSETEETTECRTFSYRSSLQNVVSSLENANVGGLFSGDPVPDVTCTVDRCRFWGEGNKCAASAIEISGNDARASRATDCATFEPV